MKEGARATGKFHPPMLPRVLPHFYGHLVKADHEPGGVSSHRAKVFSRVHT